MPQIVSVIIDRKVLPGKKPAFEHLLDGIINACSQYPGYIDTKVIKPKYAQDHCYRILFRFDSEDSLEHWISSPERMQYVDNIETLLEKPTKMQVVTGLETWFALPGEKTMTPPPRYKMAVVSCVAIAPLLMVFNFIFGAALNELPFVVRYLISTPILVAIMTYLWMPFITKLFRKWLYPA